MRAILQAVSLPSRSVKKNLEAAERQFQSEYLLYLLSLSHPTGCPLNYSFISLVLSPYKTLLNAPDLTFPTVCRMLPLPFYFVDRKRGDIEGIMDIFFEDFKNFPQTRELGEESVRFVREEMEKTWGDSRLTVLAEDEAQRWILGVSYTLWS